MNLVRYGNQLDQALPLRLFRSVFEEGVEGDMEGVMDGNMKMVIKGNMEGVHTVPQVGWVAYEI